MVQRRGANASEASHKPWSRVLWRRATALAAAHRIAHLPRSQKLNLLGCLCCVLILHCAEVFLIDLCGAAQSSAEQRRAANASAASYVSREHGAEVFLIGLCGAAQSNEGFGQCLICNCLCIGLTDSVLSSGPIVLTVPQKLIPGRSRRKSSSATVFSNSQQLGSNRSVC